MNKDLTTKKKGFFRGENSTVLLIFVGFVAAVVVLQLIASGGGEYPAMISPANLTNIVMQVAAIGIMAMGMTLIMISGGIDLSVGMLTSFVVLFIAKSFRDWSFPLAAAIIVAILLAVLFETGMGFVISRLGVEPFIITLGGQIAFRGIALLIVNSQEISMSGALDGLKNTVVPGLKDPTSGLNLNIPPYIFIFIAIVIVIWWVLKYTKYGRRIYAVGANPQAAYLAGINVKNVQLSTYSLNGLLVGIGAVCLLARVNTAIITTGANLEIDVIAAVVVGGVAMSGGKGNAWGVFIGALLMGAIANGMNILRLQAEWQFVAKGLIIIAAVSAGALTDKIQARRQVRQQNIASGRQDAQEPRSGQGE
ncbi:MAG TPA: hypothetical protein DEB31_10605 [Clostridiales bacterium]|nr:hypothetical protein [Clostridiales bacterium]